jgi:hypothetical protein
MKSEIKDDCCVRGGDDHSQKFSILLDRSREIIFFAIIWFEFEIFKG